MDRQSDLSRLRYLLVELLECDTFDATTWKEITLTYQEVNQLCERLGRLPVVVVEGDWSKAGRLTTWRPEGPPPIIVGVRATKAKPFDQALWSAMRQDQVIANLQRWVRFVDQLTITDIGRDEVGWSEPITVGDCAKQQGVKPRTVNRWVNEGTGPIEVRRVHHGWVQYRERRQ